MSEKKLETELTALQAVVAALNHEWESWLVAHHCLYLCEGKEANGGEN